MVTFKRNSYNAGGITYSILIGNIEQGRISNQHSFRLYPTNGTKYKIFMQDTENELNERNFRTLKQAKSAVRSHYDS